MGRQELRDLMADQGSRYANWLSDPGKISIPGGSESVQAAQRRASEAVRHAALFRGESVLIVGHKHINALFMCALLNEPLVRFAAHIREDTLPHLLPADAVEAFCFRRSQDTLEAANSPTRAGEKSQDTALQAPRRMRR
jgi:Histidine phosphatase superfamily (branch 1)